MEWMICESQKAVSPSKRYETTTGKKRVGEGRISALGTQIVSVARLHWKKLKDSEGHYENRQNTWNVDTASDVDEITDGQPAFWIQVLVFFCLEYQFLGLFCTKERQIPNTIQDSLYIIIKRTQSVCVQ